MKNIFKIKGIIRRTFVCICICICILSILSGCTIQFGSYVATSDYYPTPKEAYESESHFNNVEQTYLIIKEEIGVFKLDNDYSIYLVVMGIEKDNKIIGEFPTGLLMKTKDEKYYYMGNSINIHTEKDKDTQSIKTEGTERFIHIIKKDAFVKSEYNEESYNIYNFKIPENNVETEMFFAVKLLPKD